MSKLNKILKLFVLVLVGVYLCVMGVLYAVQDNLLFPAPAATVNNLPNYAQFVEMKTPDGETLRHVRLASDEGAPKLMFFHGNGSFAANELERGRILQENGFDVLLVEYRGYGGSSGKPSADDLLKDSLATYDWYNSDKSEWVFLYGHSLGTGVASYLSANRPVKSMVLEAPYANLSDVAASKHPIFPVKMLFKHEINSAEYLKGTLVPIFITHGKLDAVIPVKFGEELYQSLNRDIATLNIIADGNHNNLTQKNSIDMALGHFSKVF